MRVSERLPLGPGVVLGPAPGGFGGAGLEADLDDVVARGLLFVVCFLEDHEFEHLDGEPSADGYRTACERRGLRLQRVPVEDFAAPTWADVQTVRRFVGEATSAVYLHCMAGLGRAGTLAAALCILDGMPVEDAIMLVRWVRPGAIQSEAQERFLRGLVP